MAAKYYAVRAGKKPGIYRSWDACKAMVHGYQGAVYKSFKTMEEAQAFLAAGSGNIQNGGNMHNSGSTQGSGNTQGSGTPQNSGNIPNSGNIQGAAANGADTPEIYAFVDGSYNVATKVYGYGGFLIHHGEKEILKGAGEEPEMAAMRNVAGEILGSMAAIQKAVELGLPEVTVYYDYMGIEMWADGSWKRNKKGTAAYYDFICSVKDQIHIRFVKVKGHSGVEGNEEADRLAKEAVGNL